MSSAASSAGDVGPEADADRLGVDSRYRLDCPMRRDDGEGSLVVGGGDEHALVCAGGELVDGALGDDTSAIDDCVLVADLFHLAEQV